MPAPGKKMLGRPHLNKPSMVVHICISSYLGGIGKRTAVQGPPQIQKTTKAKKGLGEWLKSLKDSCLASLRPRVQNPNTAKKKGLLICPIHNCLVQRQG
jgi:hypothetical protein